MVNEPLSPKSSYQLDNYKNNLCITIENSNYLQYIIDTDNHKTYDELIINFKHEVINILLFIAKAIGLLNFKFLTIEDIDSVYQIYNDKNQIVAEHFYVLFSETTYKYVQLIEKYFQLRMSPLKFGNLIKYKNNFSKEYLKKYEQKIIQNKETLYLIPPTLQLKGLTEKSRRIIICDDNLILKKNEDSAKKAIEILNYYAEKVNISQKMSLLKVSDIKKVIYLTYNKIIIIFYNNSIDYVKLIKNFLEPKIDTIWFDEKKKTKKIY